jgi:hypothetical protein
MREGDEFGAGDDRKASLQVLVSEMEASLPELRAQRSSTPFANDIFEAVDDWRSACRYILVGDTKVNYQARAVSEKHLLSALSNYLQKMPVEDQRKYAPYLEMGRKTIEALEAVVSPADGHLGVLRIISEQFLFLQERYAFSMAKHPPLAIHYSSGAVFLHLEWASGSFLTCQFGLESNASQWFAIEDLLHAHGDLRYREIPYQLDLQTQEGTRKWFSYLAELIKQYGHDFLTNRPGIWEKLKHAQSARDAEIEVKNLRA